MSGRLNGRTAMLAVLGLLSTFVMALGVLAAQPAAAADNYGTRSWTGTVDCYGNLKNTGLTVNPGDTVTVSATGLCYFWSTRPSNKSPGEGLASKVGSTNFTYGAPVNTKATITGQLAFWFTDSSYSDNSGSGYNVKVSITPARVTCADVSFPARFVQRTYNNGQGSTALFTVTLWQRACWNGTQVWWDDAPRSRAYVGSVYLATSTCANSSTAVGTRRSDSVWTTCSTTLTHREDSRLGSLALIAMGGDSTSAFNINPGQSTNRFHTLRVTPKGCAFVSGVGRPGSVNC